MIGTFRPELEVSKPLTDKDRSTLQTPNKVGNLKKGLPTIKTFVADSQRASTNLKEYKFSLISKHSFVNKSSPDIHHTVHESNMTTGEDNLEVAPLHKYSEMMNIKKMNKFRQKISNEDRKYHLLAHNLCDNLKRSHIRLDVDNYKLLKEKIKEAIDLKYEKKLFHKK